MKTIHSHHNLGLILSACSLMVAILVFTINSNAQSDNKGRLMQMVQDDPATIEAIAGADIQIQRHTLQISKTPEVFDKMAELQKRSQQQFRNIIQDYDRTEQEAFYDLARYPNLISELVRDRKPSTAETNRIASSYPDDIRETAVKYSRNNFDVLVRIDRLNNSIDRSFQEYLEPYSTRTRESVNVLLSHPEIVSALVEDMSFTALLGEVYSEDPEWVINRLSRISVELAQQNREDLEAYKNQIQNDPEAYNELLEASDRYARETNNNRRYGVNSDPIVEVRVINSYPYWFGYPYWYSSPIWRPYPTYYHTGFYRNKFGNVTFTGLPSFHFIHWQTHYHPSLFPHLSYNYYNYYHNYYSNHPQRLNRPVSYHGFYRSIEANIVNNPKVNNSSLERIDQKRGNNIVRQPNTSMSNSSRRENTYPARQGGSSYSRPGSETREMVNRRGNETITNRNNEQKSSGNINNRSASRNNSNPVRVNSSNSTTRRTDSTEPRVNRSSERRQPSASSPVRTERSSRTEQAPTRTTTREKAAEVKSAPVRSSEPSASPEQKVKNISGRR